MELIEVKSSNIKAIGWEEFYQYGADTLPLPVLCIEFSHGKQYDYLDVKEEVYKEFLKSESKGKFFHSFIKNKYTEVPL